MKGINVDVPIIYAGNRAIRKNIRKILSSHKLYVVDNVLPDMATPSPESAQNKIREIFLEQIVIGKGLTDIIRMTGSQPLPTPFRCLIFSTLLINMEQ